MRPRLLPGLAATVAAALAASLVTAVPATAGSPAAAPTAAPTAAPAASSARAPIATTKDGCLKSRPEPGTQEKVKICYTIFKPAGASRRHPVPFLMHSHGWGGSRTTDPSSPEVKPYLTHGYGMLSFDQRGFGESGGFAHVENPRFEGRDNLKLIRTVSHLRWVKQDGKGDPRLGAVGGSYGGGYQFLGAFLELQRHGTPIYDALAPQITWNDLSESLGPQKVARAEWASALSAAAQDSQALEPKIEQALAEALATGDWPDGSGPSGVDLDRYFLRNGPRWHTRHGRRLDIPVLFGQGITDSLFNLQQGLDNWQEALTPRARRHSIFVGYNGGHVIPSAVPLGQAPTSDPCSRELAGSDFTALSLRFFAEKLRHHDRALHGYGRYHLATPDDTCTTVGSVVPDRAVAVDGPVATPAGASAGTTVSYPVSEGPLRIAGSAYITADATALGPDNRAFYGLAIGTNPGDAQLVQNNVYPLRIIGAATDTRVRIELPAVAVDVPEGKSLFLTASATSQDFVGMGSRTPGTVVLDNTRVHLPVVGH